MGHTPVAARGNAAGIGNLLQLLLLHPQLAEGGGQAQVSDEAGQSLDPRQGQGLVASPVPGQAPDLLGKPEELGQAVLIDVPVVHRVEAREALAVVAVRVRAQLVLHVVALEVPCLPSFTTRFSAMVAAHMRLERAV